jgi:hypothetical protein
MATAIISIYNNDPSYLLPFFDSCHLFDQSDDPIFRNDLLNKYPDTYTTENSGHSLSHYLQFIISNYKTLPSQLYFLKSNLVPRHIDLTTFKTLLSIKEMGSYVSLFNDSKFKDKKGIAYHLIPGYFLERNNSWYIESGRARYFLIYNDFLDFLYAEPIHPEYVIFTPGGCFGTSKEAIHRVPLNAWKAIYEIVTYEYFPPEAYLLERAFFTILNSPYDFNSHFSSNEWKNVLSKREIKIEKMKTIQKNVFISKFMRYSRLIKYSSLVWKVIGKYRFIRNGKY